MARAAGGPPDDRCGDPDPSWTIVRVHSDDRGPRGVLHRSDVTGGSFNDLATGDRATFRLTDGMRKEEPTARGPSKSLVALIKHRNEVRDARTADAVGQARAEDDRERRGVR